MLKTTSLHNPTVNIFCLFIVSSFSYRTTLLEWNSAHHERYAQQHQDTFLVQRSPTLKIQMGRLGEKMQVYHLPYNNVLPIPLFTPSKLPSKHIYVPQEHKSRTEISTNGCTSGKRAVEQITKALQPIKPSFKVSSFIPQQNIRCPSLH